MSAPSMLKGCFSGVSGMLQKCFRYVSEMFQKRFGDDSGMLEGCFHNVFGVIFNVSNLLQGFFSHVFKADPRWVSQVIAVPISLCIILKKADGYRSVPTQSGERYPSPCAYLIQRIIYKFDKATKTNRPKVGTASDRGTHRTLHFIQGLL